MAEPLSAVIAIVKSTWQTVEFARNAAHAQNDAKILWARVGDLTIFIDKIDAVLRDYTEPLDNSVVHIVLSALTASNQILDKLARRCLNIGDRDDLSLVHRITRPVYFTLSNKSIQKFEHDLQTHIMVLQTAFILLDRGENQESIRRIESLIMSLGARFSQIAQYTHWSYQDSIGRPHLSVQTLIDIGDQTEATTNTATGFPGFSPSVQTQMKSEIGIPSSPIELLTHQETREWGSVHRKPSETATESGNAQTECIAAIIEAIVNHSPDFEQVLADGVGLDATDDQGRTPLMHTIFQHGNRCNDCLDCMKMLLGRKFNANTNCDGETALHMAVRYNHLEAAKMLLQGDADVNASFPNTPLLLATKENQSAFVELFLAHGSNLNVADDNHRGLVHHATWHNSSEALLALLKNNKALALNLDLDARCDMDWTPLMHLAENAHWPENVHLAHTLLEYGAEVDAVDKCGNSALYYAVTIGAASPQRNKFVQELVDRGANVDAVRSKVTKRTVNKFVALKQQASPRGGTLPAMRPRPLQRL
ncbi:hypothetical protein HBH56_032340 [Parastagonospora nodorum]|uniref:Fungal N-terminal domain-containing protein n=2 Tax=Phaeosphaeria nodorum (strain SN15 / ATCC MYA-4574 / FGSC 10173) TaxID=321614 RepID=A0A7U2F7U0_PHANO|nr:hypothetical protein SNOG_07200 [Parastagonospora nodorum SN15]KAH3918140.1 hypothetical protein HBH56_032340 [Parastagonospora nodorum]EAT85851.1 hypothetical protein SNOG_07200 [Parastagonospora nodorum SN15]KAH3934049.1 hypothetical protein HBH54_067100 [Parastagonospora nodorum]KAH4075968.1 hypothetical protein HBH50_024100 [Parastagonospora nodorum]KAH4097725.1 hypothetical protein HBH48_023170 [Parastagonospora nodorum]